MYPDITLSGFWGYAGVLRLQHPWVMRDEGDLACKRLEIRELLLPDLYLGDDVPHTTPMPMGIARISGNEM
jgi:hypothetical protein